MDTLTAAAQSYTASDLDRLRSAVDDLLQFADIAAPNDRTRVRWRKVLEALRDRAEAALDLTEE